MATTVNLKRILHRKTWELCTPSLGPLSAANTTAGSFIVGDKFNLTIKAPVFFVQGVSAIYRYDADEDCWIQLPSSGATGTFAAGACGEFRGLGAMGGVFTQTAIAGTTTTITTSRTIVKNLKGTRIRVIGGSGIGYDGTISDNTIGANSVITVTTPSAVAFDATTQFQVYSGSLWFMNAGTTAVGFSSYDIATNVWTARSVTNLPTAWGTDAQLVSTIGAAVAFGSGTSSGSNTTTTINNTAKNWTVNMWTNYQVRITAGTGAGQIRTIASNTATVITVASAWTVTPDATSVYSIEGNDDYIYLMGNNAVTLYRFQVSTNTWTVMTPTAARAGAMAAGASAGWIDNASTWTLTGTETPVQFLSTPMYKQNGRYILSFRGGASNILDAYDIVANKWISGLSYGNQNETFSTGTSSCDYNGVIYIQKEATGRIFKFDIDSWDMTVATAIHYSQGTTVAGNKMFIIPYIDGGAVKVSYLYSQLHTSNYLLRMAMF